MKVSVWSGDGKTYLGTGTYLGRTTAHFFRMPDGSLRSQSDAGQEPDDGFLAAMEEVGAEHVVVHDNPKIRLDDEERTVYGCQVWWKAVEEEEALKMTPTDDALQELHFVWESGEGRGLRTLPQPKCPVGRNVCESSRNGYRCPNLRGDFWASEGGHTCAALTK